MTRRPFRLPSVRNSTRWIVLLAGVVATFRVLLATIGFTMGNIVVEGPATIIGLVGVATLASPPH
jgi:hypothetical protein